MNQRSAERRNNVLLVVLSVVAVLAIASVTIMLFLRKSPESPAPMPPDESAVVAQQEEQEQQPELQFSSERLLEAHDENPDAIGWLSLPGCEIDDVVFQGSDNDEYLRQNESGENDIWGCYFLDYINLNDGITLPDRVSIIYGHSLDDYADSERFSKLKRYKNADFCADNREFTFSLLFSDIRCEVFAACDIPVAMDYIDPNPDDEKYGTLLDYLVNNSYCDFGVTPAPEDQIVILSTCTSDENVRFVVAAKIA